MIKPGWIRALSATAGLWLISGAPLTTGVYIALAVASLIVGIATFWDIRYRTPNQFRELKSFLSLFEEENNGQQKKEA